MEAATKKHEAIETDIYAYEERVTAVVAVAKELEAENYHDISRINARKDNVLRLWNYLLELLRARRTRLELSLGLQRIFQVKNLSARKFGSFREKILGCYTMKYSLSALCKHCGYFCKQYDIFIPVHRICSTFWIGWRSLRPDFFPKTMENI